MNTLNANSDNEMDRIIAEVPADYSNFTLDEKIELCNQGLYDLNILISELNLNIGNVLKSNEDVKDNLQKSKTEILNKVKAMNKSIKKRDYFLIISNILSALAVGFVLYFGFIV